jgi:hypothetical protein
VLKQSIKPTTKGIHLILKVDTLSNLWGGTHIISSDSGHRYAGWEIPWRHMGLGGSVTLDLLYSLGIASVGRQLHR